MNVALIGPGIMSIPPKSWGAIEIILWNHKKYLEKIGVTVDLFNTPDLESVARAINGGSYDFVHLQYDAHAAFFNQRLTRPFWVTSHYGRLPHLASWSEEYKEIFSALLEAPATITLSPEIKKIYRQFGYQKPLRVLRNGVETGKYSFASQGNGKAVCVGNIQPRKRQALLAHEVEGKVEVDFIGPNFEGNQKATSQMIDLLPGASIDYSSLEVDDQFRENSTCAYLGPWNKEQIYSNLTHYSCLVLISESEADPLVVKEGLAAGLSVVVSEASAANLTKQPFIHVVSEKDLKQGKLAQVVAMAIADNDNWRPKIREYAYSRFDYSVVAREYRAIMQEFAGQPAYAPAQAALA